ncbi:uncharacterized protein LOC112350609 [Selaginella moellendorffii]|uniref:uncharacterized protein LOC112350609 n=1 Tax=Selaginella moellendorffii TaxID=88036 RepID=UPI000D1C2716|nr:uncharacterized protein LOC112350609 [Selaginella moellendorffii]|eukprot:XP_024542849.1 uncharacterized protein LOC112350609 [Selaginella moellendorffii]
MPRALVLVNLLTAKLSTSQTTSCTNGSADVCTPLMSVSLPLPKQPCFEKIYVFGDSLEDMGNLAKSTSLLIPPLSPRADSQREESSQITLERDVPVLVKVSFDNEIRWFRSKRERCDPRKSGRVAALVGGGGNDYNIQDDRNRSVSSIMETVPDVVRKVVDTVKNGDCSQRATATPDYRLRHPAEDLDEFGCVKAIGEVVKRHNSMLEAALLALYNKPHSSIPCANPQEHVYFDFVHFTDHFNKQEVRAFASTKNEKVMSLLDVCDPRPKDASKCKEISFFVILGFTRKP